MIESVIITAVIILIVSFYYLKKRSKSTKDITETGWREYSTFKNDIVSNGQIPEKVFSYGRTNFAYTENGRKIFIQTGEIPESIRLDCDDIASFEVYRDGALFGQEGLDSCFSDAQACEYPGETCFDLHITITKRDGSKIVVPILDRPAGYKYAYTRALTIAGEIITVLEKNINKHPSQEIIL